MVRKEGINGVSERMDVSGSVWSVVMFMESSVHLRKKASHLVKLLSLLKMYDFRHFLIL